MLGTTLRTRPAEQKGALMQAFSKRVVPLLARSAVRPIVDRVFALDDAVEALDAVRGPGKFGKLLLAVDPQADMPSDDRGGGPCRSATAPRRRRLRRGCPDATLRRGGVTRRERRRDRRQPGRARPR